MSNTSKYAEYAPRPAALAHAAGIGVQGETGMPAEAHLCWVLAEDTHELVAGHQLDQVRLDERHPTARGPAVGQPARAPGIDRLYRVQVWLPKRIPEAGCALVGRERRPHAPSICICNLCVKETRPLPRRRGAGRSSFPRGWLLRPRIHGRAPAS